jgi:signal transduction histidine kinase/CheY-like chemotaxis protein
LKDTVRLGLLVDSLLSSYQVRLFHGALRLARERGVSLYGFPGSVLRPESAPPTSFDGSFLYDLAGAPALDGLVVVSNILATAVGTDAVRSFCLRSELPVVSVGELPGFPHVPLESTSGLVAVIEHLVTDHHCTRIGFIRGNAGNPDSVERELAFRKTLQRLGVPVAEELILPGDFLEPSGARAVSTLLDDRGVPPSAVDALVAANDQMAVGAIRELTRRRLRVPEDVAIVGYDDDDYARSSSPPLTTVVQPIERIGARAIQLLLDHIAGEPAKERPPLVAEAVFRSSCGCRARESAPSLRAQPQDSTAATFAECETVALHRLEKITGWRPSAGAVEAFTRVLLATTDERASAATLTFEQALLQLADGGSDLLRWDYVTAPYAEAVRRQLEARREGSDVLVERLRRLQNLANDATARTHALGRLRVLQQANGVRVLGTVLTSVRSFNELRHVLGAALPGLGIRYGCVCLFVEGTDRRLGKVVAHYLSTTRSHAEVVQNDNELWGSLPRGVTPSQPPTGELLFQTRDLFPDQVAPPAYLTDLFIYPLVFANDAQGYAVFDVPDVLGHAWMLENVARHLSSAIYSILGADRLRAARDAAERASAAKTEFVAVMSHEVRTPLTAILGHLDLCLRTELGREQREHMKRARASAGALLGIINDVLDFSKIEARELELEAVEFALDEVLDQIIGACALGAMRKGLELVIDVDHQVPRVLNGDPLRLVQVLVNLVGNAIKFTPAGHVVLRIESINTAPGSRLLHLSVTDTGIGMTRDELDRIFRPFTQADSSMTRRYGGTGLGLSISKRLVELMGGELRAESSPGAGSTFSFAVTFGVEEVTAPTTDPRETRVLVVESCEPLARALQRLLEAQGHAVVLAGTAEDARSALRAAGGDAFGVVIADHTLPDGSGIDFLAQVAESSRAARIAIGPMNAEFLAPEQLRRFGIRASLAKPFHPWHVHAALRRARRTGSSTLPPEAHDLFDGVRLDGRRLLVVQDSEVTVELVRELLEHAGANVEIARDGVEAVQRVVSRQYDAILMDLNMPKLDGFAATRAIRSDPRHARVPILALTASARAEDRDRCIAAGMNDLISLPIDTRHFLSTVADRLRRRQNSSGLWSPGRHASSAALSLRGAVAGQDPAGNAAARGIMDAASALTRLGGRTDTYRRLLQRFASSHGAAIDDVKQCLRDSDTASATLLVHTLTSAAANIGAMRLHRAGMALEAALRAHDASSLSDLLAEVELAHVATLTAVSASLEERPSDPAIARAGPPPDVAPMIAQLRNLLTQNDTAAVECLERLREAAGEAYAGLPAFQRLETSLLAYDFEVARRELEKFEEALAPRPAPRPPTTGAGAW